MPSLKKEMVNGVFWSAIEKYSGLVVSILVSMVLARLLSPKEYGVVAIATVIIHFLQMFCTMGIGPAIIQRNDLTQKDLNSIFTFSLSIGFGLALLFFIGSWGIASFYDNELLVPICQILSIQVFFAAANMVPNALMNKNKRFKDIARRTLTLQTISGILAITAAFYGAGAFALLIAPVLSAIGIFVWNRIYYKVYIDWTYNLEPIKRIFSFSFYQFLFEFFNYFSRNLDKLIIGKFMSVTDLGIYEKSYRLMQLPLQNLTGVINPVLQPVLNDLQRDKKELSIKYARIVKFVATISFPTGIILAFMGKEMIHFFYGGNWDAAIPVFSILALSLPLQMILSTSGAIYLVCNNTKMQFWLGMRNTATTIVGFLLSAFVFGTIESMAWAWTVTLIINFAMSYWLMYKYVLQQPIKSLLIELVKPAINSIIVAILLFIMNRFIIVDVLIISIIIKLGVGVVASLVFIHASGQYDIIEISKKLIKR